MLALGVGLVQISSSSSGSSSSDSEVPEDADSAALLDEGDSGDRQNPLLGLVMVLMACCTSGFAGVYFEKVGADVRAAGGLVKFRSNRLAEGVTGGGLVASSMRFVWVMI